MIQVQIKNMFYSVKYTGEVYGPEVFLEFLNINMECFISKIRQGTYILIYYDDNSRWICVIIGGGPIKNYFTRTNELHPQITSININTINKCDIYEFDTTQHKMLHI